jgi:hypothetical protein
MRMTARQRGQMVMCPACRRLLTVPLFAAPRVGMDIDDAPPDFDLSHDGILA